MDDAHPRSFAGRAPWIRPACDRGCGRSLGDDAQPGPSGEQGAAGFEPHRKGVTVLRKSILFACVVVLAYASFAIADPVPYEINGQVRVRNENDKNRDFNSDTSFKSYNPMRTQLGITVHPVEDMKVFVQVQDSRVLGLEQNSSVEVSAPNTLDLHQGFFQVDNLGWPGFGIKAGRMEVRWGNERLLGVTDWNNVPTAFDGGMVSVTRERGQAQLMWSKLVEGDVPVSSTPSTVADATLIGGYGTVGINDVASADVQVINVRDKVTPDANDDKVVTAVSGRVFGQAVSRWDYSVEGAYQVGSQETGVATKVDLGSYMFGGEVGVTVGDEVRPVRFGVGYDHLSGDDPATVDKNEAFNTLFGDNHKFYGLMDVVNPQGMSSGVRDVKVNAKATVWRNTNNVVSLGGEFHNFNAAKVATGAESAIGNEVDVHATWAYRESFVPTLGVSAFMPGAAVPGPTVGTSADNAYWVYLQGVVSF
jgi:Alginate export